MRAAILALCALIGSSLSPAQAQTGAGGTPAARANAQNIIVFVADDLDWNDLPFFNPPKEWSQPDSPASGPDAVEPALGEAALRMPDFNRVAARMLAVPRNPGDPSSPARLGTIEGDDARAIRVVPIDLDGDPGDPETSTGRATADDFSYLPQSHPLGLECGAQDSERFLARCSPNTDILRGYGGLARIAREGMVFPRFYSTSARCSPARASLMTGRHPERVGVIDIKDPLEANEVTIADFLKQGCTDASKDRLCVCRGCGPGGADRAVPCDCFLGDAAACEQAAGADLYPCYTTALVGKWHLGSSVRSGQAVWQRGFDEFFGFKGGVRGHFATSPLRCSPVSARYCLGTGPGAGRRCTTDAECGTGGRCGLTNPDTHGLYVGPEAVNPCREDDDHTAAKHADCCEGEGPDSPGVYDHDVKRYPTVDSPRVEWGNERGGEWACNDDGDTRETGCVYSTRRLRDNARDFILRNADAQPFFLVVGFSAPHVPHQAPRRTRLHYASDERAYTPTKPNTKYWAMIEELDAAVGNILAVLDREGVCDGHRTIACTRGGDQCPAGDTCLLFGRCESAGWPCTKDAQCPSGDQCAHEPGLTLADKTAVFFTSDHGRNTGPFGNPATRAGKGTVYEGGVRVGLLARAPDLDLGGRRDAAVVGSMVDLFPTLAAVGGYAERLDDAGMLRLRVCAHGNSRPCTSDADCPGETNYCVLDRAIDGRNLLPALGADAVPVRDMTFAQFLKDTSTVVTRRGYYETRGCGPLGLAPCAKKVCGLDVRVPELDREAPDASAPLVRQVRGASCVPCEADGDCGGQAPSACSTNADCVEEARCEGGRCAAMCEVLGEVCADEATEARCSDDSTLTCPSSEIAELPRCVSDSDCPLKHKCVARVRGACNACMSAAWKLRNGGELYDLTSNPEEEQKLFKRDRIADGGFDEDGNGRLNCYQRVAQGEVIDPCFRPAPGSNEDKICRVQQDLRTMLTRWTGCIATPRCSEPGCGDCDNDLCESSPPRCS